MSVCGQFDNRKHRKEKPKPEMLTSQKFLGQNEASLTSTPLLFTFLAVLLISLLLIKRFFSSEPRSRNKQPPSPPRLPIVGNLHNLGSHPHRSLHRLSNRYGPLMLLHFGSVPVLVVSSAAAAREVMKTHDLAFADRPKSTVFGKLLYDHKDVAAAPYGEYWRKIKAISVVHLLSTKRVKSFRHVREEETGVLMGKISEASSASVPINLSEAFAATTNNIVCRVALGRKFEDGNFKRILNDFTELLGYVNVGDYIKWLGWVSFVSGVDAKIERVRKEIDEFVDGVVEEHLERWKHEGGFEEDDSLDNKEMDFVEVLLWIQRKNLDGFSLERVSIKALILDAFAAGTDTTYTVLEWAMTELMRHPNARKELQNEVRQIASEKPSINEDDLDKMKYLKAIIKETVRLHPPIPLLVPRQSRQDMNLQGYHIAAGTQVIVNAWSIGRESCSWERPEDFWPERFLDNFLDFKGQDFQLIPFGSSRRSCPGVSFAVAVNELVLANIVHKFDWKLVKEVEDLDVAETVGLTTHPKFPLVAIANQVVN